MLGVHYVLKNISPGNWKDGWVVKRACCLHRGSDVIPELGGTCKPVYALCACTHVCASMCMQTHTNRDTHTKSLEVLVPNMAQNPFKELEGFDFQYSCCLPLPVARDRLRDS